MAQLQHMLFYIKGRIDMDNINIFARFWFEKESKLYPNDIRSKKNSRKHTKAYLGVGRIEILERIAKSGSISKAAKEMGMSYKAAWDCVDIMNKLSPEPLVVSNNGGKGGGGTKVTPLGFQAIETFHQLERVKNIFFDYLDNVQDFTELSKRLALLESALKDFKQ